LRIIYVYSVLSPGLTYSNFDTPYYSVASGTIASTSIFVRIFYREQTRFQTLLILIVITWGFFILQILSWIIVMSYLLLLPYSLIIHILGKLTYFILNRVTKSLKIKNCTYLGNAPWLQQLLAFDWFQLVTEVIAI
jgi:hypothetical protein